VPFRGSELEIKGKTDGDSPLLGRSAVSGIFGIL
jgi:hypothetical protein